MSETLEVIDKAAGAFGLEVRYPFYDRRVVEFCLALPPEQKLSAGWSRAVLRRAMDNILPRQVQWRPQKSNLAPGFDYGLLANSGPLIKKVIRDKANEVEALVNQAALREAYERLVSGITKPEDGLDVWKAVTLAWWLQGDGLNHHMPLAHKGGDNLI